MVTIPPPQAGAPQWEACWYSWMTPGVYHFDGRCLAGNEIERWAWRRGWRGVPCASCTQLAASSIDDESSPRSRG